MDFPVYLGYAQHDDRVSDLEKVGFNPRSK